MCVCVYVCACVCIKKIEIRRVMKIIQRLFRNSWYLGLAEFRINHTK